jgi:hypothetical protein
MDNIGVADKVERYLAGLDLDMADHESVKLLNEAVLEIRLLRSFIANSGAWLPIATAPRDLRILVFTGLEIYAAYWVQHMDTGDEAWMIGEMADGLQAVVTATHWQPAPKPLCVDESESRL